MQLRLLSLLVLLSLLAACAGAEGSPTAIPAASPTATATQSAGGGSRASSMIWLWVLVLPAAAWIAHWGAEHLAKPLKKIRRQLGFAEVAGAALVGLAAASPEIGINIASALRGVSDIGLGASLGSNVLAIPLIVTVAYWASRKAELGNGEDKNAQDKNSEHPNHAQHRREHLLRIKHTAVTVQAIPYLLIVILFALLTLPPAWRGLQAVDGWILLAAYVVYLAQALWRGRQEREEVEWTKHEIGLAVAGLLALGAGAYFTVRSTENIVAALGISKIVGGLFITATLAALPEVFAVWSVTRSGQVTAAATSVMGDHAVTMTVAFVPLALVGVPIEDMQLFGTVLAFVAIMPAVFAALVHWGAPQHGFKRWQVFLLDAIYGLFVAIMLFWVLNVF